MWWFQEGQFLQILQKKCRIYPSYQSHEEVLMEIAFARLWSIAG